MQTWYERLNTVHEVSVPQPVVSQVTPKKGEPYWSLKVTLPDGSGKPVTALTSPTRFPTKEAAIRAAQDLGLSPVGATVAG